MAFFELLTAEHRAHLEQVAEALSVGAGERFIRAGETDGDLYRLVAGQLEVVDGRARPQVVLNQLGPGAVVGEMAFVSGSARSADVYASRDSRLLRWSRETLRAHLDGQPALAADFYRALALVNADRLRAASRVVAEVGQRPVKVADRAGMRGLTEVLKSVLLRLEAPLRSAKAGATRQLEEGWRDFTQGAIETLEGLEPADRRAAGTLLRREVGPYLVRARTAALSLSRGDGPSGPSELLAHIEGGSARGLDALGTLLDGLLLSAPSAVALRERQHTLLRALDLPLRESGGQAAVLPIGSGDLVALLMDRGGPSGRVSCVDSSMEQLSEMGARAPGVRLVRVDLGAMVLGEATLGLEDQGLVVLNGLVDYLPERALLHVLRAATAALRPGGWLALDLSTPSPDAELFDQLLDWPRYRRAPAGVAGLLQRLGLDVQAPVPGPGCAALVARVGVMGENSG